MGKKAYIGVNNVAKNVSKIYVGVNGVARKVVKGYVGVNGVARQFYSAREGYELDKDYQVGQSYKLVKADIATFLKDAIKAFIKLNAPYITGNAVYNNLIANVDTIVGKVLERNTNNYDSIAVNMTCGYSGYNITLILLDINLGNSDNTYHINSRNTAYGYEYCEVNPSIPGPPYSGISFTIHVNSDSITYGNNGSGGSYNLGVIGIQCEITQIHITYGNVRATNNGIKY